MNNVKVRRKVIEMNNFEGKNKSGGKAKIEPRVYFNAFKLRFNSLCEKYGTVGCGFLVPVVIFWLVYIISEQVYPFGNGSVLVLDLNGQYVYFFEALHHIMRGDASFFYSWARSLGGEFIGIYAYYLASPLSYLVGFFSSDHITEALLLIILLKCGISGGTMSFYLKKHCPTLNNIGIVTMSTMYALSSYMIAYAHNTMWIDALMLLPLTLYGCEQLIKKGNFKLYTVCLALTLTSTFYIGYMVCLFLVFYFFYYYFSCNVKYGDNNYYGEKYHFSKSLGRMALASAIAVLCACIIILPTYYSLTMGKTTFSDPEWKLASQFDLLQFFAQMLPGAYDTVRPEGLPFVYCGMLALVLLPIFFASKKIAPREKIGGAIMLALMILFMENSITDLVFHGFQRPNWLNYRYSFIFIFLVITYCARALEHIGEISLPCIIGSGGGVLILIMLVQAQKYEHIDDFLCIWISIVCLIAAVSALGILNHNNCKKIATTGAYIGLATVTCLELFGLSIHTVVSENIDVVYSTRDSYVDYMNRLSPSVTAVQKNDKSFYRMEKTVFRNVCDNMALNMRGLSNSTSTLNAATIKYLNRMGYAAASHWTKYAGGTPVSDSLLGLKYIIYDKSEENSVSGLYSEYLRDDQNKLITYLNSYALSLAYSGNSAIKDLDISDINEYASPFVTMNAIVTALLGEDEPVEVFKEIPYTLTLRSVECTYSGPAYETKLDKDGRPVLDEDGNEVTIGVPYYFYSPKTSSGKLQFSLDYPEDYVDGSSVYFFFCSNYPRKVDWTFRSTYSGTTSGTFFDYESDCIQSLGNHYAGGTSTLSVEINNDSDVFYLMQEPGVFYYLDSELFENVMARLSVGNMSINKKFSESNIGGSVTVPEGDDVMFTTIPYDEGWQIYVDGKRVAIDKTLGGLIAFDITPGEHTLKFVYRSDYMVYGFVFTLIGAAAFFVLCYVDKKFIQPDLPDKRLAFENELAEREAEEVAENEANYNALIERSDGTPPPEE